MRNFLEHFSSENWYYYKITHRETNVFCICIPTLLITTELWHGGKLKTFHILRVGKLSYLFITILNNVMILDSCHFVCLYLIGFVRLSRVGLTSSIIWRPRGCRDVSPRGEGRRIRRRRRRPAVLRRPAVGRSIFSGIFTQVWRDACTAWVR